MKRRSFISLILGGIASVPILKALNPILPSPAHDCAFLLGKGAVIEHELEPISYVGIYSGFMLIEDPR